MRTSFVRCTRDLQNIKVIFETFKIRTNLVQSNLDVGFRSSQRHILDGAEDMSRYLH